MICSPLSLSECFESRYVPHHPCLVQRTIEEYRREIVLLDRWHGRPVLVSELSDDLLTEYLYYRKQQGRSAATVKKSQQHLTAIWRFAYRKRLSEVAPFDLPQIKLSKPTPDAWTPEEVGRIIAACDQAPPVAGWSPGLWRALILTAYDTAHRIGCLLQTRVEAVDWESQTLRAAPEHTKQAAGQVHALHPETLKAIRASLLERRRLHPWPFRKVELTPQDRLFPWPLQRVTLFRHLGLILDAAGLPSTRRDKFHKLRRTSYTQVAVQLGVPAATAHAGHSQDLSRYYLDPTQMRAPAAATLIPRPQIPK